MKKQILAVTTIVLLASCNNKPSTETKTDTTANPSSAKVVALTPNGKHCFLKAENKDTTTVNLDIDNNKVIGTMVWQPYQKDGAKGTIIGILTDGIISGEYAYMIEGNNQTEQVKFRVEKDKLFKQIFELEDPSNTGKLTIKPNTKMLREELIVAINCK